MWVVISHQWGCVLISDYICLPYFCTFLLYLTSLFLHQQYIRKVLLIIITFTDILKSATSSQLKLSWLFLHLICPDFRQEFKNAVGIFVEITNILINLEIIGNFTILTFQPKHMLSLSLFFHVLKQFLTVYCYSFLNVDLAHFLLNLFLFIL